MNKSKINTPYLITSIVINECQYKRMKKNNCFVSSIVYYILLSLVFMKDNYENDPEIKESLEHIALWIKEERLRVRMSQTDLSLRAGLSPNHIYAIESGQRIPHLGTFLKICKALRLNPIKLFKPPDDERQLDKDTVINILTKYL